MSTLALRRPVLTIAVAAFLFGSPATAGAQTTVTLNAPGTQVTDVMVQAGASANLNFNNSDMFATRASTNPDYLRRGLLKFDTQNTIPAGSQIQSAVLTLTVKTAGTDASRTIGVYPVTTSFVQEEATWNLRRTATPWTTPGGDLGPEATRVVVTNVVGSKVSADVTAVVQAAVNDGTSRYTRVALADLGASTNTSYREYFSSKAPDPSARPVLTVVYAATATPPTQPATAAICPVALDKAALSVGSGQADWSIYVTAASTCAWTATSDADWLVVKSTVPTPAVGNGYAKVRAVANTVSSSKRIGRVAVNGVVYTVTQGGCGTTCTGTPTVPPPPPPVVPPPSNTLRVMQYNTHHGGWGTDGVYNPNRIVDWIIKANPDVVSMNELEVGDSWSKNLDQSEVYKTLLEQRTGMTWYKVFVNAHGATTGIGNAVFSRYPFIATASRLLSFGRAAVDATIAVNGRTINVTSTHLDNISQSNRLAEIPELLAWETTLAEERVVCGDWNAWPNSTEIATMKQTYVETWAAAKLLGTAIGNGITHGSHQIDYIFQSKGAAHLTLKSVQIFHTADASGVMPSDHDPMLAVFDVQ
jgi:endonuclease/exonuclease/phosphatase family metal-dependent hydrolase